MKKNIVANLIGGLWIAGISIVLIPQYIRILGMESYGLIGFYATIIASMNLLDFGLSTTLNRELAYNKGIKKSAEDVRNLVFTLESIYWAIGLLIALSVIALAPYLAKYWLITDTLSQHTVQQAIILMGVVFAFQWPISLYSGGLLGLEKQVLNNVINVIMTTLRSVGVLLLLWWLAPTISVFFIWQAAVSVLYVFTMRIALWRNLPKSTGNPRFSKKQLHTIWRFASGMTGIGVVTFILGQLDKIVVSKMVSLKQVGYYSLAMTVANSLIILSGPIRTTVFPRFTFFVATKDTTGIITVFHQACKLISALIFPAGLILVLFAADILLIWTKDPVIVANSIMVVRILVIGTVCNNLMMIPYVLTLSHGKTLFVVIEASIACIILLLLLFQWIHSYGILGASLGWLFTNLARLLVSIPIILRKFIPKKEIISWYIRDIILPLLPSLIAGVLIKLAIHYFYPGVHLNIITIAIISFVILSISVLFLPMSRPYFKKLVFIK
jgi:O-antigen/teichoic acid export membrane protein